MGKEFGPVVKRIDQEMINRWADFIGDYNPIHVDEEYAKTTQFGGTIAHGTLLLSFLDSLMIEEFGERWQRGGWHSEARLKLPAKPGDEVQVLGTEQDDGSFKIEWRNQRNELLIWGRVRFKEL